MRSRPLRLAFWLGGFVLYVTLCWQLADRQAHSELERVDGRLVLWWGAGLLPLLLLPGRWASRFGIRMAAVRVVWLNVGAVVLALLMPEASRFVLLCVPFIGIAFAATRLQPIDVAISAFVTWLAYGLVLLLLWRGGVINLPNELLAYVLFSLALAAMVSLGVEIARIRQQLLSQRQGLQLNLEAMRVAVFQDALTGVFNRRFVMEVLAREIAYVDREQTPLAVCYCDLDHFKAVNDQFGHAGGDRALADFADLAVSVVRSADYVARLGGEEFLLVLVGASAERARHVAQRLCARTRQLRTVCDLGTITFTVSCGVTGYRRGEGLGALLERADQALYQAKRGGRDQVVVV